MTLFIATLASLVLHEWAHARVALWCGDYTPKDRLTLNPLAHLDWRWSLLVPLASYVLTAGAVVLGMGKPVPIAYSYLTRVQQLAVASAGIEMNLIIAAVCHLAGWHELAAVNWMLAAFNLLPFPGMDGWWILKALSHTDSPRRVR